MIREQAIKTLLDLAPIAIVIVVFQLGIIRRSIPQLKRILVGLGYLVLGLTLFRIGLGTSLVPIGSDMADQLVRSAFAEGEGTLRNQAPILAFATLIGLTATLIEPTLIAAANRVQELSGGSLRARSLRLVVACGVALGFALGTLRILHAVPLAPLLAVVSSAVIVLALTAPKEIVPLALDCGGIATSVVTVPLIAAYGVAVAEALPNQTTAADGFGLIILALLLPVVVLLSFATIQARISRKASGGGSDAV